MNATTKAARRTLMTFQSSLKKGNLAMRDKNYSLAIEIYEGALGKQPEIDEILKFNIALAKRKINTESERQRLKTSLGVTYLQRTAIFAAYSAEGIIEDYVVYYLSELKKVAERIIFVSDNPLGQAELAKIEEYVDQYLCETHGEYDFGSYKRGFLLARDLGYLRTSDELIVCNDSCFGPVSEFKLAFEEMHSRKCDFWGITENDTFEHHLQSYFLVFSHAVFTHDAFQDFFLNVKKEASVQDVIKNYEVKLTSTLRKAGFTPDSLIASPDSLKISKNKKRNIEHFPCFLMENNAPLFKVKSLKKAVCNLDGFDATLQKLQSKNDVLYRAVTSNRHIFSLKKVSEVSFSVIIATYNRAHCISTAVDSLLSQSHQNFEIIIVDDGSEDQTRETIRERYQEEIENNKIIYIQLPVNRGVCTARNVGLSAARNPWVAYLDTDNVLEPQYLKLFANCIVENPNTKTFYAQLIRNEDGHVTGKAFDYENLLTGNFIDLGVFVHNIECFQKLGGFDISLRRLVDWDLILTYTKKYLPYFIPHVVLRYSNDTTDQNRISIRESATLAKLQILKKHKNLPTVTTFIPCYNQKDYIRAAIDSAVSQTGPFLHEILVSDDGSEDGTSLIIEEYLRRYPTLIRSIGTRENVGISGNFKRGFSMAAGEYIAVLEGDDYWTDKEKLSQQIAFLIDNADCSMVFSKIEVNNTKEGTKRTLSRQDSLIKNKLDGQDFINDPSMNLIGNFSCCLFRSEHIKTMPHELFEPRLSEIAVAFYLDTIGKIGYINKVMSVYRQHPTGVWTGSDRASQLRSGLEVRRLVRRISRNAYHHQIDRIIKEKYVKPLESFSEKTS